MTEQETDGTEQSAAIFDTDPTPRNGETVETNLGTAVVETPKYIRNPLTDRRENMAELSEDGYCRRFLALLYASTRPSVVNLDSSPVATFDREKWELVEGTDGHIVVQKRGVSDDG